MLEAENKTRKLIRGDIPLKREQQTSTDLYGLNKKFEVVKDRIVTLNMVRAVQTLTKEVKEAET